MEANKQANKEEQTKWSKTNENGQTKSSKADKEGQTKWRNAQVIENHRNF